MPRLALSYAVSKVHMLYILARYYSALAGLVFLIHNQHRSHTYPRPPSCSHPIHSSSLVHFCLPFWLLLVFMEFYQYNNCSWVVAADWPCVYASKAGILYYHTTGWHLLLLIRLCLLFPSVPVHPCSHEPPSSLVQYTSSPCTLGRHGIIHSYISCIALPTY